jgi:hypothetical protein
MLMVTTEQSYRKALILSLHCITTSDILRSENGGNTKRGTMKKKRIVVQYIG